MIVRPDGRSARLETLALTTEQLRWFLNGHAFLRHLADLSTVRLGCFCWACYRTGMLEAVSAVSQPEQMRYLVSCAHAGQRPLPAGEVGETDALLATQGWALKCTHRCAILGQHDGVEGFNDPTSDTLAVRCGCTERLHRLSGPAIGARA